MLQKCFEGHEREGVKRHYKSHKRGKGKRNFIDQRTKIAPVRNQRKKGGEW